MLVNDFGQVYPMSSQTSRDLGFTYQKPVHPALVLRNILICELSTRDWVAASKPQALGMVGKSHPQAALEAATLPVCFRKSRRELAILCRLLPAQFQSIFVFHRNNFALKAALFLVFGGYHPD